MYLLFPEDTSEQDLFSHAIRAGSTLGTVVVGRLSRGIPPEIAAYQYDPALEESPGGYLRAPAWGEPRDGWAPLKEIPPGGLLLPGDPDLPSERRAARAETIAAELLADPDLAELVQGHREAIAEQRAKEQERG